MTNPIFWLVINDRTTAWQDGATICYDALCDVRVRDSADEAADLAAEMRAFAPARRWYIVRAVRDGAVWRTA